MLSNNGCDSKLLDVERLLTCVEYNRFENHAQTTIKENTPVKPYSPRVMLIESLVGNVK